MIILTMLMTIGWLAISAVVGFLIFGYWVTYYWKG